MSSKRISKALTAFNELSDMVMGMTSGSTIMGSDTGNDDTANKQTVTSSVIKSIVKTMVKNHTDNTETKLSFYKSGFPVPVILTSTDLFFKSGVKPFMVIDFLQSFQDQNGFTKVSVNDVPVIVDEK